MEHFVNIESRDLGLIQWEKVQRVGWAIRYSGWPFNSKAEKCEEERDGESDEGKVS